jgi:hypothetical protein
MSDTTAPRVSSIRLDDATRARIAEELGFAGGIDAVPAEIAIAAVEPEDAGVDEPEVGGFSFLRAQNPVYVNPSVTPAVTPGRFASFERQADLGSAERWTIVTVI